jgi:hypothetical protein
MLEFTKADATLESMENCYILCQLVEDRDLPIRNNWAVGHFLGSRFDLCFVRDIALRPDLILTASDTAMRL